MNSLAVTWWGHSSMTVEISGMRLAMDPLLSDRLFHLTRTGTSPSADAAIADLVLVSHLHHDHLHLPSLRAFEAGTPILVPEGAMHAVPGLRGLHLLEVAPGDVLDVAGVTVEVLPAHHDGRRHNFSRRSAPALGFRVERADRSVWYSGDTGWHDTISEVAPVDLALVPIGGWGPTLGPGHLDPNQAAQAVALVGAGWAMPVHYGTYWPVAMRAINPRNHRRLFEMPAELFVRLLEERAADTIALTPRFGERVDLSATWQGEP